MNELTSSAQAASRGPSHDPVNSFKNGEILVQETALTISMDFANFADFWRPYLNKQGPGAQYVSMQNSDELAALERNIKRAYLDGEADGSRSYFCHGSGSEGTKELILDHADEVIE